MNTELRNRRRALAPTGLFAAIFLFGAALVARATMTALPHQTLYGISGQDTHGIVAGWTSSHNGNHFTATINWGDATTTTTGAVSSNGQKSFDAQGTHVFEAPGIYTGNVAVFDPVDDSNINIGFTAEIRPTGLQPMALAVDETSNASSDSDLDKVFEFGETVVMNPTWSTAT
ncbi:MAG TPA: hypothetical protein VG777_03860, partial [Thermoanaerobaculia bacterium]|nr:hypothetical protein [Thermoanaerobaculia bacterium]